MMVKEMPSVALSTPPISLDIDGDVGCLLAMTLLIPRAIDRDRTDNRCFTKALLYQLSYNGNLYNSKIPQSNCTIVSYLILWVDLYFALKGQKNIALGIALRFSILEPLYVLRVLRAFAFLRDILYSFEFSAFFAVSTPCPRQRGITGWQN